MSVCLTLRAVIAVCVFVGSVRVCGISTCLWDWRVPMGSARLWDERVSVG